MEVAVASRMLEDASAKCSNGNKGLVCHVLVNEFGLEGDGVWL